MGTEKRRDFHLNARAWIWNLVKVFIFVKGINQSETCMDLGDSRVISIAFVLFVIVIIFVGLYGLPINFKVDVGFINGILTASSILFGFWAFLIQKKPKHFLQKLIYGNIVRGAFNISFAILVSTVVLIYLTALDKLPSVLTLTICVVGFLLNVFFLTLTLYFYEITGIDTSQ